YDSSLSIGGYGGSENIIETDIDAVIPGDVTGFQYCSAGDMDCDGDIDDVDLALFVEQYGKD
nr:hypothetical protein [Desulfobacterales bacterium]